MFSPSAVPSIASDTCHPFRAAALRKGYSLIRLRTRMKVPVAEGWNAGEPSDLLLSHDPRTRNTGLVLKGFRAIDLDVDDPEIVGAILDRADAYLPKDGLKRFRTGSARVALLFRAKDDLPARKRRLQGSNGLIEILATGQQLMVDGIHPTGAPIEWTEGRSPATVSASDLPEVTDDQLDEFLGSCSSLLGDVQTDDVDRSNVVHLPTAERPKSFDSSQDGIDELGAGITSCTWFDQLIPGAKRDVIIACLGALDNRSSDPRDEWLRVLFALADAGSRGCLDARRLALDWSRQGKGWTSEADFDVAWHSYKPGRITIGTLLHLAQKAGAQLDAWRDVGLAQITPQVTSTIADPSAPAEQKKSDMLRMAVGIGAVPAIPPKRQWLHGTDVVRGAVTLLVAPGGRGKSSWLTVLALACASGRSLLGSNVFGGPLRVLYINAEDSLDEVGLRMRAAMQHHNLTDPDLAGLFIAGANTIPFSLIRMERTGPTADEVGWTIFDRQIAELRPDIVILDPLVAFTGGVTLNDNAAASVLMRRLASAAAANKLGVVVAHHAAKGRDVTSAEAAMGAASLVNLARVSIAVEPLAASDAGKVGVLPWEAGSIFRIVGTKQNLAPPGQQDRWHRIVPVQMANAMPPIYPHGDSVAVVESFQPQTMATPFPHAMTQAVLAVIATASPLLSPSSKSPEYAVPVIRRALDPYRGGQAPGQVRGRIVTS